MNPFIESTLAKPLQGAAAQWRASRRVVQPRLARQPLSASPVLPVHPSRQGGGRISQGRALRRLACGAVVALGLMFSGPGQVWAVDVNRATVQELQTIRGIGPKTAQAIVEERSRGGGFESFDDLSERVKGIGAKRTQSLRSAGLTLSAQPAPAAKRPAAPR